MTLLARLFWKVLYFPLTRMVIAIVAIVAGMVLEGVLLQRIGGSYRTHRSDLVRCALGRDHDHHHLLGLRRLRETLRAASNRGTVEKAGSA